MFQLYRELMFWVWDPFLGSGPFFPANLTLVNGQCGAWTPIREIQLQLRALCAAIGAEKRLQTEH